MAPCLRSPLALASLLFALAACSSGRRDAGLAPPAFGAAKFTSPTAVTNPLLPLVPGDTDLFVEQDGEARETIVVEVLPATRTVLGIPCVVVRDRVYADGLLVEDTHDWYAQDDAGNVWYMGEQVDNYTYDEDGNVTALDHDGAWEAGRDVQGLGTIAQPGFAMLAAPRAGDRYLQESYRGEAEDTGEVVALGVPVTLADGSTFSCVQIRDASRIASGAQFKYYAPGVGLVREADANGGGAVAERVAGLRPGPGSVPPFAAATFTAPTDLTNPLFAYRMGRTQVLFGATADGGETIVVERVDEAKTVLGIACAVVRDRVFRDGLLVEDTRDWYAQDDAGNVWYMGEAVDNHEYDEQGNLVAVTHEGSWEAGLDVAGIGVPAAPGWQLPAAPVAGQQYHQEWYPGEATDIALVVATGVEVTLPDGRAFADCVQTLDWNPLDPDGVEYKFYAPGHGLVLEQGLHDGESVAQAGEFAQGADAVPDFAAATFANPTLIDHPFVPLPAGATWHYEQATDEGLETIDVEVLSGTRVVAGVVCVVVRDVVRLDGLTIEDTRDWYAQDDAGNVWYMGEEVDNYHYVNGVLTGITHEGSWQAGLDVAQVGQIARPGFLMPAVPVAGTSYYQEYYRTAAEDMAFVVATGVTVEVDGELVSGCVQTLDWNPLAPDAVEHKFYAPGIGLVLERHLGDEAATELTASSLLP